MKQLTTYDKFSLVKLLNGIVVIPDSISSFVRVFISLGIILLPQFQNIAEEDRLLIQIISAIIVKGILDLIRYLQKYYFSKKSSDNTNF